MGSLSRFLACSLSLAPALAAPAAAQQRPPANDDLLRRCDQVVRVRR